MAPQGVGAALAMPLAGRLTDRVGGGRVALVGLLILTLGDDAVRVHRRPTPPTGCSRRCWSCAASGSAATMMPAMAAAYATLTRDAVPRATSALNVLQRVGGSIGTALLAVVLQHQITTSSRPPAANAPAGGGALERVPEDVRARVAEPLATAFAQHVLVGGRDVRARARPGGGARAQPARERRARRRRSRSRRSRSPERGGAAQRLCAFRIALSCLATPRAPARRPQARGLDPKRLRAASSSRRSPPGEPRRT